jgi:DNA polymerase I-like protein with 3'-5' exonuclease and polymerase domains
MTIAIDFESYYDSETSVTTLGAYNYARKTDIYMVAMYSDAGWAYVGLPKNAPWAACEGHDWVMHNAAFDLTLLEALIEQGVVPPTKPADVYDTADMAAYFGYPRSLKEAAKYLLNLELSKGTRDNMKGRHYHLPPGVLVPKRKRMDDDFKKEITRYALNDAKATLLLWRCHGHKWPEHERKISQMTREMTMKGVPLSLTRLDAARVTLEEEAARAAALIPWAGKSDVALLSLQAIRDQCDKEGIRKPTTFAEKTTEGAEWEAEFADQFPWVRAVRDFRKANKHTKTVEAMRKRLKPGSVWMPYDMKYFGALTGRDSGSGGWNAQNLPKGHVAGVDIRNLIEAPPGKAFVIADLAQIEARCICYLAGDQKSLELMAGGADVYEAHARATMGYTDPRPLKEVNNKMRQLAKARVLGLGYGCGAEKFRYVAKIMAGLDISAEEALEIVQSYRKTNPLITGLWWKLDKAMKAAVNEKNQTFELTLPSGRTLTYREVTTSGEGRGDYRCKIPRGGTMAPTKLYGGLLAENATQAFARDVFMDRCIALHEAGADIIMRVHDEVVILCEERLSENYKTDVEAILSTPPDWCPTLPLGAEALISKFYMK